jgi:hypothetical protein
MEPFENRIVRVWQDSGKLIHVSLLRSFGFNENDITEYVETCIGIAAGKQGCVLLDLREINYLTPGAMKKFFDPRLTSLTKACAVLISSKSPLVSLGVSFLLKFNQDTLPVEVFTNEQKAVDWLKQFV